MRAEDIWRQWASAILAERNQKPSRWRTILFAPFSPPVNAFNRWRSLMDPWFQRASRAQGFGTLLACWMLVFHEWTTSGLLTVTGAAGMVLIATYTEPTRS